MTNVEGRRPEGAPERSPKAGEGAASGVDGKVAKRFSVQRKMAVVARMLRGEPLELVARETNVSIVDGKRQEILIEAVPGLRRMAALADSNRTAGSRLQALNEEAHLRNVELSVHQIAKPEEIPAAIDAAKTSGAAALNLLSSPLLYGNRQLIMDRVAALRLPTIYFFPEVAGEGGFVACGARVVELFREVMAQQLVKLLRGTKPADIPIEQPTKFELVINLKTATALGITVPATLVARADKVIE